MKFSLRWWHFRNGAKTKVYNDKNLFQLGLTLRASEARNAVAFLRGILTKVILSKRPTISDTMARHSGRPPAGKMLPSC